MKRSRVSQEGRFTLTELLVGMVILGMLAWVIHTIVSDSVDLHHLQDLESDASGLVEDFCSAENRRQAASVAADYQDTAREYKNLRAEFIQNRKLSDKFPEVQLPPLGSEVASECPTQARWLGSPTRLPGAETSTPG